MSDACALVQAAVDRGDIPGAAIAIGDARDVSIACLGAVAPDDAPVTPDTWYDLASLTKVIATTTLLLRDIMRGTIDPSASLSAYLPEASWLQAAPRLGDATVSDCAHHATGLPAWRPFYTQGLTREALIAQVLQSPLEHAPGTVVYSDLGFITLGHLLERVNGERLDALFAREIADEAFAADLRFGHVGEPCAPTEKCPWRSRLLRGEAHDENASVMDGVSGHAGLFGTIAGVAGFCHAILNERLLTHNALQFVSRRPRQGASGERRGFGWALASPGWSGGDLCSDRSIGHTGFTGTGLWIDLERDAFAVLLTNRVHPTRHRETGIVGLRRRFANAAFAR